MSLREKNINNSMDTYSNKMIVADVSNQSEQDLFLSISLLDL